MHNLTGGKEEKLIKQMGFWPKKRCWDEIERKKEALVLGLERKKRGTRQVGIKENFLSYKGAASITRGLLTFCNITALERIWVAHGNRREEAYGNSTVVAIEKEIEEKNQRPRNSISLIYLLCCLFFDYV